nr:PRC-barrel domain-containing protein [Microvirga sp. HBU67558]
MEQSRLVPTSAGIPAETGSAGPGPVAGSSTVGVAIVDVRTLYSGYSVKNQILGREIYNDRGERVGHVTDLIVAPDKVATYAIVGTGGFLDLGEHLTAVPVSQFTLKDGEIMLPNATRQSLEAMPRFVRASNE